MSGSVTDRINAITLVLEQDIRDDAIQPLIDACQMLKGVLGVKLNATNTDEMLAEMRVRNDLELKIWKALRTDE